MKRIPHTWANGIGKDITAAFMGISEILARLAEPFMRYSTIYLALATALPIIKWMPLYNAALIAVIATPEFVLLGALSVAENALKEGRRKWGIILYLVCGLLACIMIATFVEIFIVHFDELAVKALNFCRCLAAVGFSIVLSKLAEPVETEPAHVQSPVPNLTQIEQQVNLLGEQMNLLVQQVQQAFISERQEVQSLVQSFVSEQRVNTEPSLNLDQVTSEAGSIALNQKIEPPEPTRMNQSLEPVQVQSKPAKMNHRAKVQAEPVQTEPVNVQSESVQVRVSRFIEQEVKLTGTIPKLDEIMQACGCSKGSASQYRREFSELHKVV